MIWFSYKATSLVVELVRTNDQGASAVSMIEEAEARTVHDITSINFLDMYQRRTIVRMPWRWWCFEWKCIAREWNIPLEGLSISESIIQMVLESYQLFHDRHLWKVVLSSSWSNSWWRCNSCFGSRDYLYLQVSHAKAERPKAGSVLHNCRLSVASSAPLQGGGGTRWKNEIENAIEN